MQFGVMLLAKPDHIQRTIVIGMVGLYATATVDPGLARSTRKAPILQCALHRVVCPPLLGCFLSPVSLSIGSADRFKAARA